METQIKTYNFSFKGKGSDFFGVVVVNWLLTIITLGLYYPWAKERTLKYLYANSYLEGDNFQFTGTGKEMFIGFIKIFGIVAAFYIGIIIAIKTQNTFLMGISVFLFYMFFLVIIPFAIHGFYKYRMSRTNWRGVRFGYRGDRGTLMKIYFKDLFLTIITFGIYSFWMTTDIRNYTLSNVKFGSAEFKYKASGSDYFWLNVKGIILTYVTLGIYSFWFQRDILRFYFDHLTLHNGNEKVRFQSKLSAGDIFELLIINMLILMFTLGLGYAFVEVRTLTKLFSSLEMVGNINLDSLQQTEEEYKNAFGDEALDAMDLSGII
ncbi:YjgN family protein [Epilithonimonas sp.]|uniref:YjgN family protein n=1 Tax=Epilithonimonas sp. TaxID=2894511 RepID=UPI002FDDB4FE